MNVDDEAAVKIHSYIYHVSEPTRDGGRDETWGECECEKKTPLQVGVR